MSKCNPKRHCPPGQKTKIYKVVGPPGPQGPKGLDGNNTTIIPFSMGSVDTAVPISKTPFNGSSGNLTVISFGNNKTPITYFNTGSGNYLYLGGNNEFGFTCPSDGTLSKLFATVSTVGSTVNVNDPNLFVSPFQVIVSIFIYRCDNNTGKTYTETILKATTENFEQFDPINEETGHCIKDNTNTVDVLAGDVILLSTYIIDKGETPQESITAGYMVSAGLMYTITF